MKIFLDTSCLFKLCYHEVGTQEIEKILTENVVTTIFLSEIAKLEFASTVWKKVRKREIKEIQADIMLQLFKRDSDKYTFIVIDSIIIEEAKNLIARYGSEGLRTLDSIQLSTSILLRNQANLFKTTDELLKSFLEQESLLT